ncbi:type III-B CRISPR module-associated Cmr3 family protein [Merismopedia glauca]|uniref:CRISPR-associated protein Cmr3 n=1 Tax=Merismopedia glauca CCAP 1448/3 TaxID=1296344 RepID=A0A2T1C0L4_9CYAN|nr:type III-B CRISPR module-associated Cmr3 family protein [Merismopedia glauca]PSB01663.1 CRISPR-associated protein Cmr3 [Merismopedia glauca CCAP 1448/3]
MGLLYGSAGGFLSPENLVGRSNASFPPSSATLSGIFAAHYGDRSEELLNLQLAGAFWAKIGKEQEFYVPTPFNSLFNDGKIGSDLITWQCDRWHYSTNSSKAEEGTWLSISEWDKLQTPDGEKPTVSKPPWEFVPHLHPRLEDDERRVKRLDENGTNNDGTLFLENAVQLKPDACLIYLSNIELPSAWYRFGGEGHLVEIESLKLDNPAKKWLETPLPRSFAIVTPAVWGSNRLSYREPMVKKGEQWYSVWFPNYKEYEKPILTQRPKPTRYRLGKQENHDPQQPKLLSRGRYAVPAGTIYVLDEPLNNTWQSWDDSWFPKEGHYYFKRWGYGLALPLGNAITPESKSKSVLENNIQE